MNIWDWSILLGIVLFAWWAKIPQDLAYRIRMARHHKHLPLLDEWDERLADPASGLWRISPPCGWETWNLYGPGTEHDEWGFFKNVEPAAKFDATEGPGYEDDNPTLAEIREWAVPWIEHVSGGRVEEIVEGWSGPYGEHGEMREYAVFAKVAGGS